MYYGGVHMKKKIIDTPVAKVSGKTNEKLINIIYNTPQVTEDPNKSVTAQEKLRKIGFKF